MLEGSWDSLTSCLGKARYGAKGVQVGNGNVINLMWIAVNKCYGIWIGGEHYHQLYRGVASGLL